MDGASCRAIVPVLLACAVSLAAAQDTKGLTHNFTVAPGATVAISNDYGPITVRAVAGTQVTSTTGSHSSNVQIVASQDVKANRIELRSHHLRTPGSEPVDYTVEVPPDTALVVHTSAGPVRIQGVQGAITVDSDTGSVEISQSSRGPASNAAIRIHTIDAPVTLADLNGGSVNVATVSGQVTLNDVTAPSITVDTNSAPIRFSGDLLSGSTCDLSTHSADIDVALPATASVDVTATSVQGTVQDAFQLQPDSHPALAMGAGKSFAGHANAGAAKLTLRSFSGKITVHKE